jgi:NDP-sugar pyrophosphorylase family protein
MILAAGRGTRLGQLGRSVAKPLVPVGGRPLLERQLEYLERERLSRVVINTHHLAGQVSSFVARYRGPLDVSCIEEESLLGTAGGVRNALPRLGRGPFLVLYGDVLVDEPLAPLFDFHRARRALATLAMYEEEATEGKGVVHVDDSGRVTGFQEKQQQRDGRLLVNAGVYVMEPQLVSSLPAGTPNDFGHDVFPRAVDRGLPIFGYRIAERVIDIGTPDGLALACRAVGAAP